MPIIPGNFAHLSQQPVKEPDYLDKYSEPVNDVSAPEALPEPDYLDKYSEPVTNELGVVEGQVRGITRGATRMIAGAHGMIAAAMAPEPLSEDEIKSRVKKWTPPLPQLKSLNLPQTREEYESYLRSLSKGDSEYQRQLSMSNAESNLANDPSLAPSASVMSGTLSDKVKNWRWFSENLAELLPQVVASAGAGVATGGTSPALQVGAYAAVAALPEAGQAYTESINRGSSPEVAKAEAALIGVGNAALEAIPGSELLLRTPASRKMFSKLVQSKAGDLLTSTVAVGAGEGVTELGQEFLSDTVRYVMENDPSAYHDWKSRYPMAAILGASMGTGMGATGRAVGATIGDNPLGQPAPADELIAKAPAVAEFLAGRMSENGKVSRTEWAKAAADAKEAGVHLPYYKRAENATAYATGVVEAMQAKKQPSSEAIPGIEIPPVNVELPPQKDSAPPQSPAVPAAPQETPEVPQVAPGTPDQSPEAGKMVEPQGPVASFQTESGSTYTINGQSTTRDKAERLAHGDDKGLKEPSTRTVYVDSATATAIGDAFLTKGHPKPPTLTATESDGVKTIFVTRFAGKKGKEAIGHMGEYSDQPAVGLHPIEVWIDEAGKLKSVHPGSKIVSVVPASQPPAVETNQPIAETPASAPETAAAPVVEAPPVAETPVAPPAEKPKKKPKAGLTKPKAEPETMVTTPRGTKIMAPPSDPAARDEWLVQNARVVAAANGDSDISDLVRDLDPKEITPEVRAELNKYLTGEEAKPLAPAEDASKTMPVASEVPTQTPVSKEPTNGQESSQGESQGKQEGEPQGRKEGLLAKKVEPATESSAPASTKLSPGHDETYREHLPILEKQVGNETAPNRQLQAADGVARGLPPAVRQALYDHLKTIAPEAYRFGLERGRFVSSESAEFDKKLYAQLKYVNDKANGRGPKNAKEPEQVADLDALGYTTKNVKFVTKLTDDGHRRMVSIQNDIDKANRDMTDAEAKAAAEKRDAERESEKPKAGITKEVAYHGSKHKFDQFSTGRIGTGEGAQAFGHGLYFSSRKDVAEYYRRTLAGKSQKTQIVDQGIESDVIATGMRHATIEQIKSAHPDLWNRFENDLYQYAMRKLSDKELLNEWNNVFFISEYNQNNPETRGHLYQVELKPDQDEYLLWDEKLVDQSDKVKAGAEAVLDEMRRMGYVVRDNAHYMDQWTGKQLSQESSRMFDPGDLATKEGADLLLKNGIRGIKYLDGDSRSKGEGSYNYVVFSDDDVSIIPDSTVTSPTNMVNVPSKQVPIAGLESAVADAEAVRQVWGPIERDLSVDYKPEFVDQYKPVILRSIPKIVEYEIDQLRDSGMTLGEMREALKDIANEVDIDLPFPDTTDYLPDPITGRAPATKIMEGMDDRRIEVVRDYLNKQLEAKFEKKLPDIEAELKKRKDEDEREQAKAITEDTVDYLDISTDPYSPDDIAELDRQFEEKAKKHGYDFENLKEAWKQWKAENLTTQTADEAKTVDDVVAESVTDTPEVTEKPKSDFKRKTLDRVDGKREREQWRTEKQRLYEEMEPLRVQLGKLNVEMNGLRSNATRMRAKVQEKMNPIEFQLKGLRAENKAIDDKLDEALLEDRVEDAKTEPDRLRALMELHRHRANTLPRDRWGNAQNEVEYAKRIAESDKYADQLKDIVSGMVKKDDGLDDSEFTEAVRLSLYNWRLDEGLDKSVREAIAQVRETRLPGTERAIKKLTSLATDRQQAYMDELTQTSKAGKDWRSVQAEIEARAKAENDKAYADQKEQREIQAKIDAELAAKEADELRLANRQKAQQRFMEVRFWDESKKRGTDIEFEDYYQDTDGVLKPNDKNRVKTDGQNKAFRLGKFAIIETEVDANESGVSKAKKKKGSDKVTVYRTIHINTGNQIATSNTLASAKSFFSLASDVGFDLQTIGDKGGFPDGPKQIANEILQAWTNDDLSLLSDDLRAKALGKVQIAPHNVAADYVMNSFELGKYGTASERALAGITDNGLERVRAIAESTPVFRAHPVFNVDAGGLSLKIGGLTLKLPASDFNLAGAEVLGLKTVGINLDDLGIKTISALTPAEAIAETLKDFGFSSATASGEKVTGTWKDTKVTISGSNNQWKAEGTSTAAKQADAILKQVGWLAGDGPVQIVTKDYEAKPRTDQGKFHIPEQEAEYKKNLKPIAKIAKSTDDDMTKAKAISELMVKKSLHANQVGVAILEQVAKTNPDLIRLMALKSTWNGGTGINFSIHQTAEKLADKLPPLNPGQLVAYHQKAYDEAVPKLNDAVTGKSSVDAKANAAIEVLTGKETPVVEALANHLADTNEEVFELARNLAKDPGVYGPMGRISLERVMSKRGQPNISKAASRARRDVPVFHYEASTENSNPSKENPAKGPKITNDVVRDAIKNDYSEDKEITSKPPTTKYGKKLMASLEADAKKKSGFKVGLRSIVDFLAARMHVPIRVGNTQLDSPAHYQSGGASSEGTWFTHLIRSKEGYSQVNHHELGHALSAMVRNVSPSLLKRLDEKLVKLTYMHRSLASANTAEEGFAEFVRRMIVTPLSIPKSFKAEIKEAIDKVDPKFMQEIEDAHRAYTFHRNRSPMQQLTANNNDRGLGPKFAANFREAIYNFLFNVVGKGVIVRKVEKEVQASIASGDTTIDKAQAIDPTGIIGTLRELVSPAYRKKLDDSRKFMASLQNTNADIDAARQSMDVDAPGEVSFMIHGIANGREGVRFRNDIPSPRITKSGRSKKVDPDNSPVSVVNGKPVSVGNLTPKQLKALGEAGFVIPEAVGQGEHLYLSDKSLDKIRSEVGADHWEQFATYGRYRAIHSRWKTSVARGKRYDYPGRLDGFPPTKMQQFLRDTEAAHPEWKKSFKDVEGIFSALLMSSVISGEFSVADAIKIRTAYPDYWPLEVIKEGQTPTSRGMVNGHPTSKIRRSIGSPLEKLPIEIQVASRIKRHVDAYYHSRFTATMARFVGKAASRKASSFGARAAASNMLVPLKMDTKLGEVVSEQEERDMIVDALHRQMLMSVDIDPALSTNLSGKKLKQYVEAAGLEPVDPELVIVSTPHRKLWRKSEPNAIYVTSSFKNGKRQYWQVGDSLLYKLFAGHGSAGVGKGLDMAGYYLALAFGGPQKAFSRAITRTLRFALGNVGLRDILTSMMNGKGWRSMIPGFYSMLAITRRIESKIPWIAKLTGNDQLSMDEVRAESQILARQLKAQRGNVHDTLSQRFLEDAKDMLAEGVWIEDFSKMNWRTQLAHVPGIAASSLTKIVDIGNYVTGGRYLSAEGEAITREGGFWDSIMQGDTNERASMNYSKLTGNFGQRPGSPNFALLVGTASFLNASIQSSYQFYDNFTDPDPKNRLIATMKIVPISIMAASAAALSHLLMALVYGDDPEELEKKRNQLRERTDEERTRAVSIGGIFRMPFGPGLPNAIFAYVYNRIEGAIINDPVDPSLAASKVLDSITDLPYGSELIQPQVKALAEIYMNKSFFYKRKLVPSWIERNFPDNPELREYTSTPEFYKSAGRLTGMSPLNIQHFVRNGLSAELDYYIGLADKITDGDPVKFTDMPPLGRMMFREPVGLQSASVDTISGLDDEYQQVTARLKDMLKRDPQNEQVKVLYAKAQELAAPHQMMKQIDKMYRAAKTLKSQKKFDESRAVEQRMTDAAAEFLKRLKEVREAKKADLLK